jgi:hypothetical protein
MIGCGGPLAAGVVVSSIYDLQAVFSDAPGVNCDGNCDEYAL